MNRRYQRIDAFTLWEMIFVMLMISILVSLSYGAYLSFSSRLKKDQDHADRLLGIIDFEKRLHALVDQCDYMEEFDQSVILVLDDRESSIIMEDSILYVQFSEEDLLELPVMDLKIEDIDVKPGLDSSRYIGSFTIQLAIGPELYFLHFHKRYSRAFKYSLDTS